MKLVVYIQCSDVSTTFWQSHAEIFTPIMSHDFWLDHDILRYEGVSQSQACPSAFLLTIQKIMPVLIDLVSWIS